MSPDELDAQVAGIAALAEPVRRDLFLFVNDRHAPVTRDEAAAALGIPRHTVKFHLDKLVEEGLLDVDYKRLGDREGPGAGRPAKRYRRSDRELHVALPGRRYDLAGSLLATAVEQAASGGADVLDSLHRAAAAKGAAIGAEAGSALSVHASGAARLSAVCTTLAAYGYEPHPLGGTVELANCPFHALAQEHTDLVCGMNLALVGAVVAAVDDGALAARLEPGVGRCCVVIDAAAG